MFLNGPIGDAFWNAVFSRMLNGASRLGDANNQPWFGYMGYAQNAVISSGSATPTIAPENPYQAWMMNVPFVPPPTPSAPLSPVAPSAAGSSLAPSATTPITTTLPATRFAASTRPAQPAGTYEPGSIAYGPNGDDFGRAVIEPAPAAKSPLPWGLIVAALLAMSQS